jgi:hypothetical protein
MTFLADQPRSRVLAWSFAGFTALVLVAAMVLLGLNARVVSTARIGAYAFVGAGCLVYAGIGGLLASRVPRNVIGWLLGLTGFWVAANLFLEQYGLRGLATAPGSLPAVRTVTALGQSATNLIFATLILVVLLFPTGWLPSKWWRPVLWASVWVIVFGGVAQTLQRGTVIQGGLTDALQTAHVAYPNPLGVFPRNGWYGGLSAVTAVIAGACAVLAIVSVFWRRRAAPAELRQQLAWLGYVGALFVAFAVVAFTYTAVTHGGDAPLGTLLFVVLFGIPLLGIPAACAVAVLRYHLYDLDIVIRKTVVAALVAAAFTAIYALIVLGVGAAVGHPGNSALTFAAAALAAAALLPLRARAGRLADRLVYSRRATPYEVLSEFAGRVAGTYSTDQVLPEMARMLAGATGAQRAEVWMQVGGEIRREAAWPAGSPAGRDGWTREFAVEHHGERLGWLRLTSGPGSR